MYLAGGPLGISQSYHLLIRPVLVPLESEILFFVGVTLELRGQKSLIVEDFSLKMTFL